VGCVVWTLCCFMCLGGVWFCVVYLWCCSVVFTVVVFVASVLGVICSFAVCVWGMVGVIN